MKRFLPIIVAMAFGLVGCGSSAIQTAPVHKPVKTSETQTEKAYCQQVVDRQIVYERDEGICGICKESVDRDDFHIDHVIPLARGGKHSYADVQVAHPVCNSRKGARI